MSQQIFIHRNAETGIVCGPPTITELTDWLDVRRAYVSDQLRIACLIECSVGERVRVETVDEYDHVVSKSPGFGDPASHHLPPSLSQNTN